MDKFRFYNSAKNIYHYISNIFNDMNFYLNNPKRLKEELSAILNQVTSLKHDVTLFGMRNSFENVYIEQIKEIEFVLYSTIQRTNSNNRNNIRNNIIIISYLAKDLKKICKVMQDLI